MPMYRSIEPNFYSDYGIVENPKLPDGVHFMRGALIQEPLPSPLIFQVNFPKSVPIPHMLGDRIPVVSDLFVAALRKAGIDNFQLFPALLRNPKEGVEWSGYHALNVLGLLDAADMDASKYQTLMAGNDQVPALVEFEELVLSGAATSEQPMFRIVQEPSQLLIHERVVDVLKSETPPDGWGIIATEVEVR